MTDNEIRIAIAEACGWKLYPAPVGGAIVNPWFAPDGRYCSAPPNYANSLDAMHEAEKVLFPVTVSQLYEPDLWKEYRMTLEQLCMGHAGGAIRAPAKQRAIAVLHTIGKWKD